MSKVYVVRNGDGIIAGVTTNEIAAKYAKKTGKSVWGETWEIEEHELDYLRVILPDYYLNNKHERSMSKL